MNKFLFLVLCLLLTGCATKREAREMVRVVEVHDTLRQDVLRTDSVFVRDSVRVWMHGDTIYKDRLRVEYRDRWRDRVQEVVKFKVDTIIQRDVVVKEATLSLWQKVKSSAVWFVGGLAAMFLIILGFKVSKN